MADALHRVVAVRVGFTRVVQLTTPPGRSGVRAGTKHSSSAARGIVLIHCSLCARGARVIAATAAPERGFVLMWRRKWAVNRAVAALFEFRDKPILTAIFRPHYRCIGKSFVLYILGVYINRFFYTYSEYILIGLACLSFFDAFHFLFLRFCDVHTHAAHCRMANPPPKT